MDSLGGGGGTSLGAAEIGREYELGRRRFRLLRLLGEGGYSFVYLAREVTPPDSAGLLAGGGSGAGGSGEQRLFALKRVRAGPLTAWVLAGFWSGGKTDGFTGSLPACLLQLGAACPRPAVPDAPLWAHTRTTHAGAVRRPRPAGRGAARGGGDAAPGAPPLPAAPAGLGGQRAAAGGRRGAAGGGHAVPRWALLLGRALAQGGALACMRRRGHAAWGCAILRPLMSSTRPARSLRRRQPV